MKNKLILIVTLLLILIPIKIEAASIKSTSAVGLSSVEVGEEIKVKFYINFDGINKNDTESLGVYELIYEIMYDERVLELKTVYSSAFNTIAFEEKGTKFVYSVLQENIPSTVRCSDGILFCSSYMMEATFKALNNSKESTEISIGDVEVAVHPMSTDGNIYEDDITYISTSSLATKKIKITKPTTNSNNSSSSNNNNNSNDTSTNEQKKSTNKYLKELKIKDYEIDFDKKQNNYEITVPKSVNKLEIEATPEDNKATFEITGNDDLLKYNNKAFVVVTAEDGSTNTYVINVNHSIDEELEIEEVPKEKDKEKEEKKINITKDQMILISIGLGSILLIFIIVFIIIKINDRKIDKALDDL